MAKFSIRFVSSIDYKLFLSYVKGGVLADYLDSHHDMTINFRVRTQEQAYDIRGLIVKTLKNMNIKFTTP